MILNIENVINIEKMIFPKIIWTCWFQGRNEMPLIVEKCVASLERENQDWQIIVVNKENATQYVPEMSRFLDRNDISWTGKSDILRLYLLAEYGGVWCDSTIFCNNAFNNWLPEYLKSGFFAFQRTDRYMLSSWFLAAVKGCPLIIYWKSFIDWYWSKKFKRNQEINEHKITGASTLFGDKLTEWIDKKNISTSIWFSFFIRNILRITPYFWIHYAFEYLFKRKKEFRKIWDNTPKFSADLPHSIQSYGMFREDIDNEFWNNILQKKCPVYKLSWKNTNENYSKDALVYKLLENNGYRKADFLSDDITKTIGKDWVQKAYYDIAESEKALSLFWNENTVFYNSFCQLDCTNIVELACGHGRHVQKYYEKAQNITLVDINQENIDFCKNRFFDKERINYLVNNGNNFHGINSNSQTSIFSYDAMVHFDLIDIYEYLKESNRILVKDGKILFHHSNAAFSPEKYYLEKPHGRNIMSADTFAYLALRTGFIILKQDIFHWGSKDSKKYPLAENIDCLSLCQKTKSIF